MLQTELLGPFMSGEKVSGSYGGRLYQAAASGGYIYQRTLDCQSGK